MFEILKTGCLSFPILPPFLLTPDGGSQDRENIVFFFYFYYSILFGMKNLSHVVNFLFEMGILAKTPRSGFYFLGSENQSVSEHIHRTAMVGYALAMLEKNVDLSKVLKMCLFHDMAESRVSDLNYVHQKYTHRDEQRAIEDLAQTLPFGDDIRAITQEYHDRKSREALLAKDADILELILSLKEQLDIGNKRARSWLKNVVQRLQTPIAKKLAAMILKTDSDEWWFKDKDDEWWVTRQKKKS
jgi:putative hydrolase of HD superfamily